MRQGCFTPGSSSPSVLQLIFCWFLLWSGYSACLWIFEPFVHKLKLVLFLHPTFCFTFYSKRWPHCMTSYVDTRTFQSHVMVRAHPSKTKGNYLLLQHPALFWFHAFPPDVGASPQGLVRHWSWVLRFGSESVSGMGCSQGSVCAGQSAAPDEIYMHGLFLVSGALSCWNRK